MKEAGAPSGWHSPLAYASAYALAGGVSLLFLYPYWWMLVSAFRSTREMLSAPLRLRARALRSLDSVRDRRIGNVELWRYGLNSVMITCADDFLASRSPRSAPMPWCASPGCPASASCATAS